MRRRRSARPFGQSMLEYAVFVAVVSAAVAGMSIYIRRTIQATIKTTEMQVNPEPLSTP